MESTEIKQRTEKAIAYFENGYSCSQAVLLAYADKYGISEATAAALSGSFGGGMGRLREVCGALSGGLMVLGLEYPYTNTTPKEHKNTNYAMVQKTALEFKAIMGSYICAELLSKKQMPEQPIPDDRNDNYYALRPCTRCVAIAAKLVGEAINNE